MLCVKFKRKIHIKLIFTKHAHMKWQLSLVEKEHIMSLLLNKCECTHMW